MSTRHLCAASLLGLLVTACLPAEVTPTPSFEADDVRLEMPSGDFRTLGERGEVMDMADDVAADVNGWVVEMAVNFGEMLDELALQPPTDEVDGWRIYGPFDADNGEDLSWLARVFGDETEAQFEILAGPAGVDEADLLVVFSGGLKEETGARSGNVSIDFDAIAAIEPLRRDVDEDGSFGGSISVEFSRETETAAKTVELSFDGFHYANDEEDLQYRDESYLFDRHPDGAGSFHFATWATNEEHGWSGPERERITVDMLWDDNRAGRARARVLEVDGEGDLFHGNLEIHECFDAGFSMTWAGVSEAYEAATDYDHGDPATCSIGADAFED